MVDVLPQPRRGLFFGGRGGAMVAFLRSLRGDQQRSGSLGLLKAGAVQGGSGGEGVTWMCGRRPPRAPLERVELLAGAMGDGGGFQRHGNGQDGSGSGFGVKSGVFRGLNVATNQILSEVSNRYQWFWY